MRLLTAGSLVRVQLGEPRDMSYDISLFWFKEFLFDDLLFNSRVSMNFQLVLLAVKNVEVFKRFYGELFDQTLTLDLGKNVTFSGGFAIQEDFAWLTDISAESMVQKSNNMELYFEVDDFEDFIQKVQAYPNVNYVHQPKMYEWKQRVVRIYDPDCHMIEIGESMAIIARRYLSDGYSVEETSAIIQHPIEFVKSCLPLN
jgi:predicted enzyme related to lactoylglutathione lyase